MSRWFDQHEATGSFPYFEGLEERLLLTTIRGGEFLIYHNSQGETVRLSLNGAPSDAIEVFAHHVDAPYLVDLPGYLNAVTPVGWSDLAPNPGDPQVPLAARHILRPADPYSTARFEDQSFTEMGGDDPSQFDLMWLEHGDRYALRNNPDPAQEGDWYKVERSSRSDIFAIFVASCSAGTTISLSTLNPPPFDPSRNNPPWYADYNTWTSATLPLIQNYQLTPQPNFQNPPAGSGGTIVGAYHFPKTDDPKNIPRWVGVPETLVMDAPLTGMFPGGSLSSGITVSSDLYRISSLTPMGTNVQALGVDPLGGIFGVDSAPFVGTILEPSSLGDIGDNINAIAASPTGTLYVVDAGRSPLFSTGNEFVTGAGTNALAVDSQGQFYAINESDGWLVRTTMNGNRVLVGGLQDSSEVTFSYRMFTGLDFKPGTGELWGVATLIDTNPNADPAPDSAGPFLVVVSTRAVNNRVSVERRAELAVPTADPPPALPWQPDQAPPLASIVWSPDGTKLFGVTTTNQLVRINVTTGVYAPVGWGAPPGDETETATLTVGADPLASVVGLDFIGNTLYGITGDGQTFYLDDNQLLVNENNVDTSQVVLLGSTGLPSLRCLAIDANNPAYFYTVADDNAVNRLTAIPVHDGLKRVATNGTSVAVAVLYDTVEKTFGFSNVTALEYRGATLYAVATVEDLDPVAAPTPAAGRYLVTLNTTTGATTRIGAITNASDLTTLAYDAGGADVFYGVDPANNHLISVNPATGAGTDLGDLGVGIVGLEWIDMGGTPVLLGVDATNAYSVDVATQTATLLADTGRVALTGLTYSPTRPGYLWSVDNVDYDAVAGEPGEAYHLVSLPMTSRLMYSDGRGTITERAVLFDDTNPIYAYTNVTGMAFDGAGTPYAVAEVMSLDPLNDDPGLTNAVLVTVDESTGVVTRVVELDVPTLSTIVFGDSGGVEVLYGFDPAAQSVVTVDPATGVTTEVLALGADVTGLAFFGDVLYAITGSAFYTVDLDLGTLTPVPNGDMPGNVTSLASGDDPTTAAVDTVFWAVNNYPTGSYLLKVFPDAESAIQDLGTVMIGGSLCGEMINAGSIITSRIGFLWGGIDSGRNIEYMYLRYGGGNIGNAYQAGAFALVGQSHIRAGGTLGFLDVRNNATLSSSIEADQIEGLPLPSASFRELENYGDYLNDSMETAQFLDHPSGVITLSGALPMPGEAITVMPDGASVTVDYYAVSMMAGQTITIDGWLDPFRMFPMLWAGVEVRIYDSKGNWLATHGYETEEDWGVGSRPGPDEPVMHVPGTKEVLEFTAPAAGIYYLAVVDRPPYGAMYFLDITGLTGAAIGAVNVIGDYEWAFHYVPGLLSRTLYPVNVATRNGGDLGAFAIRNSSLGTEAMTVGGGNVVAFEVGDTGADVLVLNGIDSSGNIGKVGTTKGDMLMNMYTGSVEAVDAFAQNILCAGSFLGSLHATGSLGVMEVAGTFVGGMIHVNMDELGPSGHVDMIEVGGDWGQRLPTPSVPLLRRGQNGDIGAVHVGGTIYVNYGTRIDAVQETVLTQGQTAVLNDDGGGKLTVTPQVTYMLDNNGDFVLDTYGRPIMYTPTIAYSYIGVDDDPNPGVGDGGVIANLRISGSASLSTKGAVQISHLDLDYAAADITTRVITITGDAPVDIYNVTASQPIDAIINETAGTLTAGNLVGGVGTIVLRHGSLGPAVSRTGTWLHGPMVAPTSAGLATEPQFGYYNGMLNGLNVEGDLPNLVVGGYLGDLRVTGTLGVVVVNADKTRLPGEWHGVQGLVWAGQRIEAIDVGNGLADDGSSDRAMAGIMCGGSIGTVYIKGPRREVNGVVFGEINGSILGVSNDTVDVQMPDGTTVQVERDAVGQVIGTDGAQCTGIIGAMVLTAFKCWAVDPPATGGVGRVLFSGQGAMLHGAEAVGEYVREFATDAQAMGMTDCYITGTAARPDGMSVGRVAAGGFGLQHVVISGNGGSIGVIEGLGPEADIDRSYSMGVDMFGFPALLPWDSSFVSSDRIDVIRARSMHHTHIAATGTVGTIRMTGDVSDNYDPYSTWTVWEFIGGQLVEVPLVMATDFYLAVGAIGNMTVDGDFRGNSWTVSGEIGKMVIGGDFDNNILRVTGADGNIRYMEVKGNILRAKNNLLVGTTVEPEIRSTGEIGSLITQGRIEAAIITTGGEGATSSDIGLIRTGQGYFGELDVAGSLGQFECATDLGRNPALFPVGQLQVFNVQGDLGVLKVRGTRDDPSNLYADFNIGGNTGTIDIDGDYFGQVRMLGDLKQIKVGGRFGGDPGVDVAAPMGVNRGSLDVGGTIGRMQFTSRQSVDMAVNIVSGGSIQNITLRNGDVLGDITSRYGEILGVSVSNGSIMGSISGTAVRNVSVRNGNLQGDVTATNGDIRSISVTGGRNDPNTGNLLGNVVANNGRILSLKVSNGNVGSAAANYVISATGGMKRMTVSNGDWLAAVDSDGVIDALSVRGNMNGVLIGADGGIRRFDVSGDMTDVTVRTAAKIDRFNVRGNMTGSTVGAGWDIGSASVGGNMTGSMFLAGYDVGENASSVLGGDGTGLFAPLASVAIGEGLRDIALGDLNGDGAPDLVAITGANVVVLLGRGDGTFGTRRLYETGADPSAVALGDLNADNDLDIVVANAGDDNVSILLGNGDGTFQDPTTVSVGAIGPRDVAIADVTNDGIPDLITANEGDDSITIRAGNGDGTFMFAFVVVLDAGDAPRALAIADMDVQNGNDIVVVNGGSDRIAILPNAGGDWGFGQVDYVGVGANPQAVALGDLDGDGDLDVVVANRGSNDLSVLLTDPFVALPLTFTPAANVDLGAGAEPIAVVLDQIDPGSDAFADLIVLNYGTEAVVPLLGDGTGAFTFQPTVATGSAPAALAVGDVDSDDDLDIVVADTTSGANPLNNGAPHAGNVKSLSVRGNFDSSIVAAGIAPGADGSFLTLGDNVEAPGYSTIGKVTVRGQFLNPAASALVADSAIDAKSLAAAAGAGVNVPAGFITNVLDGAGTDFGRDTPVGATCTHDIPGVGTLTLRLSQGRANYDDAGNLVLEETTSRSSLNIQWRGTGAYPNVIHITGSEDSGLSTLSVRGDVTLGNIGTPAGDDGIDGPVRSMTVGAVEDGSVWTLPGGVNSVRLQDLNNLTVNAGSIRSWTMRGAFVGGSLTADELGSFSVRGDAGADVMTSLGEMRSFSVTGDYSGNVSTFLGLRSVSIRGAFSGEIQVERGDMRSMKVGSGFTGKVNVVSGEVGSVSIAAGNFGVDPDVDPNDDTSFRAAGGIRTFTVSRGNFHGLVSTGGDMRTVSVRQGVMTGKLRARGSIATAQFGSMDGGIATAGGNFLNIRITGDMFGSSIYAGFDPGDAGYDLLRGGESANVQIDAFTPGGWRTPGNRDQALGGDIRTVSIGGEVGQKFDPVLGMWVFEGCTISAAVGPGVDGYCGTTDDVVAGTGHLYKVTVYGGIYGNNLPGEAYGFFAASAVPSVTAWRGDVFGGNDNVYVAAAPVTVGTLRVVELSMRSSSLVVTFNHGINWGTINTAQLDPTRPTTFDLVVSANLTFGDGDDVSISDAVPNTLSYDPNECTVTLSLSPGQTWNSLGLGTHYMLTIEDTVLNVRGSMLDGEYSGTFPSGNRVPGGDFQAMFDYGSLVLSDVPVYLEYHGVVPTVVGMLAGYYDSKGQFSGLIPGSARIQTAAVNEVIASSGTDGADLDTDPDPGTGHVPDYALYALYDDAADLFAYPDLSDPAVVASTGIVAHDDNCIADFLLASRSYVNGGAVSFVHGETDHPYIEQGIEAYFAWAPGEPDGSPSNRYQADATLYTMLNEGEDALWDRLVTEIGEGRPVVLGVDTTGFSFLPDHYVLAIGYDIATRQYVCYDPSSSSLQREQWYDWAAAATGWAYGVATFTTVEVSLVP